MYISDKYFFGTSIDYTINITNEKKTLYLRQNSVSCWPSQTLVLSDTYLTITPVFMIRGLRGRVSAHAIIKHKNSPVATGTTLLLQLFCGSSFLNVRMQSSNDKYYYILISILTEQTIQSTALCINLNVEVMRKE